MAKRDMQVVKLTATVTGGAGSQISPTNLGRFRGIIRGVVIQGPGTATVTITGQRSRGVDFRTLFNKASYNATINQEGFGLSVDNYDASFTAFASSEATPQFLVNEFVKLTIASATADGDYELYLLLEG